MDNFAHVLCIFQWLMVDNCKTLYSQLDGVPEDFLSLGNQRLLNIFFLLQKEVDLEKSLDINDAGF